MIYPSYAIDEVMQRNDIVDVIGSYTRLVPKGSSYMGLCPFHKERTPSFSVSPDKQLFHCFGCGESGNVFGFIMKSENLSFTEAIQFLALRVNYSLPEREPDKDAAKKKELKSKLFELNKLAARFFYDRLNAEEGAAAQAYLDKRGVSHQTRKRFGLGYAPLNYTSILNFFNTKGYSSDIIKASGLVLHEGRPRDKFVNRLMFPIFEPFGEITGFGGRALDDTGVKYLNSPETLVFEKSKNLYGINFARKSKANRFLLCEGYMDVIALAQAGYDNAIAALGTAFNLYHANLFKRYAKKCVLLFDSDDAGIKATLRTIPVLEEAGVSVSVLSLKNAKDPDEFLKAYGKSAFDEALLTAVSSVTFRIGRIKCAYDLSKPDGKAEFGREAAKLLARIPGKIEQSAYAKEVADMVGIPVSAVIAEINGDSRGADVSVSKRIKTNNNGAIMAKKSLIRLAASSPSLALAIKNAVNTDNLSDTTYAKLLDAIFEHAEKGVILPPAELISIFETYEEQKTAADVFSADLPDVSGSAAAVITQLVREISIDYIEKQIAQAAQANDIQALNALNAKKREIAGFKIDLPGR